MKKRFLAILLALVMALALLPTAAPAAETAPVSSGNINAQEYVNGRRWAQTVKSHLYENSSGGLTRVEYAGGQIIVEDYNSRFELQSSRTIPVELSIWGGFFAGKDYNFLMFGQDNKEENDSKEVIRIVKYSKDWQRLGAVGLYGANTIQPFEAGSARFAEYSGYLYIRTSHKMYASKNDGKNHQANVMINVRQSDMKITDSFYLVESSVGYVSHSFNQFLLVDSLGRIVALDHGDAYPRSALLQRYVVKAGQDSFRLSEENKWIWTDMGGGHMVGKPAPVSEEATLVTFPGSTGANDTGAALGGLAETSNGYVTAYNFDGTASNLGTDPRNVCLAFTDKNLSDTTTVQLSSGGDTSVPVLAPTGLDGGYVMWNGRTSSSWYSSAIDNKLYYARYDAGGKAGAVQTATAALSDCAPVVWNGKVVWYVTNNSVPTFYTLDSSGVKAYTAGVGTPSSQQPTLPAVDNIPATGTAVASAQTVLLDGKQVQFQMYALIDEMGNPSNYIKLRDLANVLNGTRAQFEVGWNGKVIITSNTAYTPNGSEGKTPFSGDRTFQRDANPVIFNGNDVPMTAFRLTDQAGNGYTYYKLRDLGQLLNFNVRWDGAARMVCVETDKPYTGK